ncbi:MAG: PH domain-containing protein [Patescibacteria group bacterium]
MLFEKFRLEEDEELIRIIRRHWFIPAMEFFGLAVLATVPLIFFLLLQNVPENEFFTPEDFVAYIGVFLFLSAAWTLMLVMAAAMVWTHHYLDMWVITNRRIILIDQVRLFNRQIGSFRLERLQDLNIEVRGIIATFLNFGTVEAQTASGSEEEFRGGGLPDPQGIKSLILQKSEERVRELNNTNL